MGSITQLLPALLGVLPVLTEGDKLLGNLFGSLRGSIGIEGDAT